MEYIYKTINHIGIHIYNFDCSQPSISVLFSFPKSHFWVAAAVTLFSNFSLCLSRHVGHWRHSREVGHIRHIKIREIHIMEVGESAKRRLLSFAGGGSGASSGGGGSRRGRGSRSGRLCKARAFACS